MNNATTYIQGANPLSYEQTIPTVSAVGGLCRVDATPQRPKRNTKRQKKVRASKPTSNGFLDCQFLPKTKLDECEKSKTKKEIKQIEKGFYKSINQVAAHYQIELIKTRQLSYPNNLQTACWDIETKLKKYPQSNHRLQIVKTEDDQTYLKIVKSYETESYLHYLCVYPLFQMLNDRYNQATKNLLLSVFSYLYRKVGIPFYRDEDAYLSWLLDMLKDWMQDDEEYFNEIDGKTILKEIQRTEYIGDTILNKIRNENNLHFWKQRLDTFYCKNEFDRKLFDIAQKLYKLWQDYPNDSIFRNIQTQSDAYYYEEVLPMYKYLSFTCFFEGLLYEQMTEIINSDLAEYGESEEPTICELFNGSKVVDANFDFEHRFFTLFEQLINLF